MVLLLSILIRLADTCGEGTDMEKRTLSLIVLLAVIVVVAAAVIPVAYAFISETTNSGNDYRGEPTVILVKDEKGNNKQMMLPTNVGEITGNGPWKFENNHFTITGYLDIKCPHDSGKMRVWIDMKDPRSWGVIDRISMTLYLQDEQGNDKNVTQIIYGADSELYEVGGEPTRDVFDVKTWTGNDRKKFTIDVKYREDIYINPYTIGEDLLKSRINFISGTEDPINSLKVNFYVGGVMKTTVSGYQGNVLNPPSLSEGYGVQGWFMQENGSHQGTGEQWDFATRHLDVDKDGFVNNQLNLYAKYGMVVYSIKYEGGGTASNPTTYNVDSNITLAEPVLSGYTFLGWTGTGLNDYTKTVKIKDMTGDRVYTAHWGYTITFNKNGGSGTMTSQDMVKDSYTSLKKNEFTHATKVFYGWNTNSSGTGKSYVDNETVSDMSEGERTLYAVWKDKCTLTYNNNGGAGDPPVPVSNITPGTVLKVSDKGDITTPGFIGWTTAADGSGAFYTVGSSITVVDNTTLFAVYSDRTVTFNANGGSGTMGSQPVSSKYPSYLNPNTFSYATYAFYGWNTQSDGKGTYYQDRGLIAPGADTQLYAMWGHEVVYYPNGADAGSVPSTVSQNDHIVVASKGDLLKTGCVFKGWNTQSDGKGVQYSEGEYIPLTANISLYAVWSCDLVYNENYAGGVTRTISMISDTEVTIDSAPTRSDSGYIFVVWNTRPDGTGDDYAPDTKIAVERNLTLYAIWRPYVTITFDNNLSGGSHQTKEQLVPSGVRTLLDSNTFVNGVMAFYGWSTANDGSGAYYPNGAGITVTENTTLYAIWKWTVTLHYEEDQKPQQVIVVPKVYVSDNTNMEQPVELDGYEVKWYTDSDLTQEFEFDNKGMSKSKVTSNLDLYSRWYVLVHFISAGYADRLQVFEFGVPTQINSSMVFDNSKQIGWNTRDGGEGTYYAKDASISPTYTLGLYAVMKTSPQKYHITFNANGGVGTMDPVVKDSKGSVILPSNTFTRKDMTFQGWTTSPTGAGTLIDDGGSYNLQSDTTLFARWRCTVAFNANSGSGTMTDQTITSMKAENLNTNTFTRSGYTFYGWNTKSDGTGDRYTDGQSVTIDSNITLYAMWNCKIVFNANGGIGTMEDQSIVSYGTVNLTSIGESITRGEYVFFKWNTRDDGAGEYYTDGQSITIENESITLYAIWGHKITFTGGSETTGSIPDMICKDGANQTLPSSSPIKKDGFAFYKWKDAEDTEYADGVVVTVNADIALTAEWGHSVTYLPNGAKGVPPAKVVVLGDTVAASDKAGLERAGYTFANWNTAPNGAGTPYAVGASVDTTSNVILYAQWTPVSYAITYHLDDGTATNPTTYHVDDPLITLNNPTKAGFSFVGWSGTDLIGSGNTTVTIATGSTGAREYTAHWAKFSVVFDPNGGYGKMETQILSPNTSTPLTSNTFNRAYFTFNGWNTKADGTGTGYTDRQAVTLDSSVTLYAQWAHTVTFESNGGSAVSPVKVSHGVVITAPSPSPTKASSTFAGWFKDGELTEAWNFSTDRVTTNITLYAKWEDAA